jgi:hypothetical protein
MPISGAKRIRLCEVGVSGMPRLSGGLVKHLANQITANEELALAA